MIVKDCTNVNKTNNHSFSPEITEHKKGCDILHWKSSFFFGHAKKCGRLIQFMGSKSPSLDVCIDLVHHEALSITHSWSHFNYSPLTSNQSMISYMYGLITDNDHEDNTHSWRKTHNLFSTKVYMYIHLYRKMNDNFLEERVCYMQCSICWTKRKGVLHAMFNLLN